MNKSSNATKVEKLAKESELNNLEQDIKDKQGIRKGHNDEHSEAEDDSD